MEITLLQAFLIGLIYYMGHNGNPILGIVGSIGWMRPLVCGTVVGVVLGEPVQGCILGAAITLPYLAFISAGGTQPLDPALAGTLGTAFAIAANIEPTVAVTLAVPLGILGSLIWIAHMTIDIVFIHMIDKAAEEGNLTKANFIHFFPPQIIVFFLAVIPVTLCSYYGTSVLVGLLELLSGKPLEILSVIGGILPALGIALNLRAINGIGTLPFFLLGFLATVYSGISIIGISLFAAILAYVFTVVYLREDSV